MEARRPEYIHTFWDTTVGGITLTRGIRFDPDQPRSAPSKYPSFLLLAPVDDISMLQITDAYDPELCEVFHGDMFDISTAILDELNSLPDDILVNLTPLQLRKQLIVNRVDVKASRTTLLGYVKGIENSWKKR